MRRWLLVLLVLVIVGLGAAVYFLMPVRGPVRDLTLTADAARGAYLIRLGGCISCHTDRANGVAELGGGAGLATPFGTFYPPNISPHPEAGIGGWTLAQFAAAMSDGEGPQGHLYPAFPYDAYTLMSDQDVVDLYAALMAATPVAGPSRPHEIMFPFNIRLAMAGWKTLFFKPRRFSPDPAQSPDWNRGAYIANGPGHCITCHSPRNLFGAIEAGQEFAGNRSGGPGGRAPSLLAADLSGRGYDEALLIDALRTGFTADSDVLAGAMAETIEDSTKHLTDEDLRALAVYLLDETR